MLQVVESGGDLWAALLGDEQFEEELTNEVSMRTRGKVHTTMLAAPKMKSSLRNPTLKQNPDANLLAIRRRAGAVTRLAKAYKTDTPVLDP